MGASPMEVVDMAAMATPSWLNHADAEQFRDRLLDEALSSAEPQQPQEADRGQRRASADRGGEPSTKRPRLG